MTGATIPAEATRIENTLPAKVIEVLPAALTAEINSALAMVPAEINADTFERGNDASVKLYDIAKRIEKQRKAVTKPVADLKKAIDAVCKAAIAPLDEANNGKHGLKRRLGDYMRECERIRREAEEVQRKAEEKARREAEEAQRKRDEASAAARAKREAELPDLFGGFEDGDAMAEGETEVIHAPTPAPRVDLPAMPKASGVVLRRRKILRVVDRDAVPRAYWTLNESMLRRDVVERGIDVPGACIDEIEEVAQKSQRPGAHV